MKFKTTLAVLVALLTIYIVSATVSPFDQCVYLLYPNGTPITGGACDFTDNNSVFTYEAMTEGAGGIYCIGINSSDFSTGRYSYAVNCTYGNLTGTLSSSFIVDAVSGGVSSSNGDLSYPYFMDVNTTERIEFYMSYLSLYPGHHLVISFGGANYNLTDSGDGILWYVDVTSAIIEDVPFDIMLSNNTGSFALANGTMRWRISFNVTITFYKDNSSENPGVYKNDFQYVYLQKQNLTSGNPLPDASYLDSWFSWLPFYTPVFTKTLDRTISFWGVYNNGQAKIKLYEAGNYTIGMINVPVKGLNWSYEFIYPQFASNKYKSKIINNNQAVPLTEASSIDVYISQWEVNKQKVLSNWIYNIVVIGLGILLFVLVAKFGGIQSAFLVAVGFILVMKLLGLVIL